MQDKSFTTYVKVIVTHLPTIQAKSAANPFAGALAPDETKTGKTNRKKTKSEKAHEKTIAALTVQIANLTSSNHNPHSKPSSTFTPSPITPAHMYCYFHGHSLTHGRHATAGQVGGECKKMLYNPADFTPEMIAARSPTQCPGGNTNVERPKSSNVGEPPIPPHPSFHY